ncbi:ArsR/SmtB family transcription factor [Caulobacter mirabilis]|uniref:Transcriptional regulator n=1 Tax=Caulobacter mirabilis TaxID=69666 RepID=A0A2D2AVR2_9CAUL|nr:metalloregulator ArsR/SmtB family transcription factor [Caulobacter mirabilis]ATQ42094.1 transcriptional regulator [Caulobacter mirabilis]
MSTAKALRALANERRLQILEWLKDPVTHFPPQIYGDLEEDGVCVLEIADKLGVAQPTATSHLQILADAGLVRPRRIRQWTFYRREEEAIAALKAELASTI